MGSGKEWEEKLRGHGLPMRRLSGLSTAQGHLDPRERDTQESAPRSGLGRLRDLMTKPLLKLRFSYFSWLAETLSQVMENR